MTFYGLSDIGNVRKNNEDSFSVESLSENCIIAVVADGMGGHTGGKRASSDAVDLIMNIVKRKHGDFPSYSENDFKNLLTSTIVDVNKKIYESSSCDNELLGMGTTVVACIAYNNKFYAANVGDSRLYMFDGRLNQVTKDHSFVRELIDMGLINEQQAKSHPNKNVITRAIGTDNNVTADIYSGKLNENDILMICTDGLTNMVSDDEIERILSSEKTLAEMTNILIDNAKTSGGRDNITIVCIKINDGGTNKI